MSNTTDNEPGEALPPERIWINSPAEVTEHDQRWWYKHPMAFPTVEYVRAPLAAVGDGISWTALLTVLERLRSKNKNPEADWYNGWNAAIQCLINDINSRAAAASSPAPAEPPSNDAKFIPPAEDALHVAICQAVQEHHGPSANAILRTALNDYKPTQLTRTELIRVQQRSGSGEVTAVMVSPAEPLQPEGEQEREVQCADCLTWFKPDTNHTCRQQVRRNQRSAK